MHGILKWLDKIRLPDNNGCSSVRSICYNSDGTKLVVAAAERVLIYDSNDGTLLNTLKAHKDIVNCVDYAKDDKKFASGGADKTVIVWSYQLEGLLKYSHSDSVQCLCFNPITHHLASCSISDYAFWSADQKAVQKYKIHSRVNVCCWTNDGQYIIMGLANGSITVRNKLGEENCRFDRSNASRSAIYGLQCCPILNENYTDIIAVADWGQTLSFYNINGEMIGKERSLGFNPLCLVYIPNGEYCFVAGCTGLVNCFTREGVPLGILGDSLDTSWIWSIAVHPNGKSYTVGYQNGQLISYSIIMTTVHALYRDRYAFREHMCDVIVQQLTTGQKVRIKCRDLIQKVAIYRNRLAIQLSERIILYELSSTADKPMYYTVKEKIQKKLDCSLLVICACHLVLCQDEKLQCLDFNGVIKRELIMRAFVRYIKVIGGSPGREGLMVGLKNGEVYRIFIDNASPVLITNVFSGVRCLDVNASRTKIAVVDDDGRLLVRDIINDSLLYHDTDVNSVVWNIHHDSMLCYTHTMGGLSIRVGNLPPRPPQHMLGVVVGLYGSTAFCLRGNIMHNIPLALSVTMWQFIEVGLFEEAYKIACLGVTNLDWVDLGKSSLEALHLKIARDAYVKVRDLPWLQLINDLIEKQKGGTIPKEALQAEFYIYMKQHKEAARLFLKCNQSMKALEMYTDLRMFDVAQDFIQDGNDIEKRALICKRAEWSYSIKEPRAASQLYLSIGDYDKAIEIVSEQGWADVLYDIGQRLDQSDTKDLLLVANNLKRLKALPLAAKIFKKLGNEAQVVELHIESRDWYGAFRLAESMPHLLPQVYYQHAQWLAENDDFIKAHEAYLKSGYIKDANRLLKQLISSGIEEERFLDVSYFYWLLSKQYLHIYYEKETQNLVDYHLTEHNNYTRIAKIYYAYSVVYSYMKEPFTTYSPISLFNVSRFILNEVENQGAPKGVSMFSVLFTLAKQAKCLQANKLCLIINKRLQSLKPPPGVQEQIDINYLNSKICMNGFNDPEELLPLCYKCSNYSQHLNDNTCPSCKQDYVFSFISFEILPLVQFYPEIDITDSEAEKLLLAPPQNNETYDPFKEDVANNLPLNLDRNALRSMDSNHVLILKRYDSPQSKYTFYRNILPDLQISYCQYCLLTFYVEDFELQILQKGYCPFCRTPAEKLLDLC